ncbi:MAG: penicillin-binding protein 2 [bacterium]|nr:penicillin-binding protein 2 [bacterium]
MATQTQFSNQQTILRQRAPLVLVGVIAMAAVLLLRIISFQFPTDPRVQAEFQLMRDANSGRIERIESPRGEIYDRNGNPLAVNTLLYRIGISPGLISNKTKVATDLARILNRDELEMFESLTNGAVWVPLGTVDPETWYQIRELDIFGIEVERVQRRVYPQGPLGAQVIGFVNGIGEDSRGNYGVEGYYQSELAGQARDRAVSNIPFDLPQDTGVLNSGATLVLTIDRNVQFLIESELQRAITETGATGGTIIIMNPRTGDILGMASYPSFDPNAYFDVQNPLELQNPAISGLFEPGSVFKVITVAAALETGTITPDWTYNDQGELEMGGIRIQNWDRVAHGVVDVRRILVESLNIGTATIAQEMGWELFYEMLNRFGIGSLTRVDLQGEQPGILRTPDDLSGQWSESDLGTNSFGQGLSVTPLQMLVAVNAIANGGVMMQPRLVHQIVDGDKIYESRPMPLGTTTISQETARIVTDMMVDVVEIGLDDAARVPGYTIAGKTGTAEIGTPVGYETGAYIMSFVGFLPADDPQVSIFIKLDRPQNGRWASDVVAPIFSRMTSRLVYLLEIPNDETRLKLLAQNSGAGG